VDCWSPLNRPEKVCKNRINHCEKTTPAKHTFGIGGIVALSCGAFMVSLLICRSQTHHPLKMAPIKINIFLSYAPEDRRQLNILLRWLYPMRDEVNLWYYDPPQQPSPLSLPWKILLFWYTPPNPLERYARIQEARRENAHIYLFLLSYKSLSNHTVAGEATVAIQRRLEGDDVRGPLILPVLLSPCRWKETSSLAGFSPMAAGRPLSSFTPEEEGYLTITEELSVRVKALRSRRIEEIFYQSRPGANSHPLSNTARGDPSHLGELSEKLDFEVLEPFYAPEWLGWSLIFFICISIVSYLMPTRIALQDRYERIKSASDHGWEYLREHPMVAPKDSFYFPPADQ
jgi:hypothetical protein